MLVEKIGLDAVIFLRFTRMLRNIFLILGIIGLCVMVPVNVADRDKSISSGLNAFAIMTPLYVFGGGLWAQVVCAWVFDAIVGYFLWYNYRKVHKLRRDYFQSPEYQQSLHARTLLVTDLPPEMRSDEGVMRLTDEVNPLGILPKTTVGRNVRVLPELIEEHEENVKKLEGVLATYLKDPDKLPATRPTMRAPKSHRGEAVGGKVDAIEYLTNRIRELEDQINDVRERLDKRDAMSYGFASWERIDQAHAIAFAARKKHPQGATIHLSTRPQDYIWDNLGLTKAQRKTKKLLSIFWIALLTILWMPLNAAIAIFLSNLSNLGSVWHGFQSSLETHKAWWALVQGIAAPAITSIVYLVLPIIFRRLQVRAGDATKTSREHHVLRNLFVFFTLNNLIIFSLFSAFWQYITHVVQANNSSVWDALKAGQFFLTVTTALCQISPFWVIWLLQRNLGAAIDIAQLWTLFYVWFCRTFRSPTPRQNIEWTAPPPFDYASYYNYFLFYSTVALCFSTLQPIVLLVTAIYFTIDCVLKKYLLMYVFITKTESGGTFWKTLYNRLLFALVLSNVIIAVVVKARGSWVMVAAIAPLPFLIGGLKYYTTKTYDEDLQYYVKSGMRDQEQLAPKGRPKSMAMVATKFGHPALFKPLMTPMVHARARNVLGQVYRGRLHSDGIARATTFSDIALEPMNKDGTSDQAAPFELVPEAQQDFAYYKGRSDFREEGGDIYGKPEDQISEGSRTPKTFTGYEDSQWSPASSRPGTPSLERAVPALMRKDVGSGVKRKAFDSANVHPDIRSGYSTREQSLERPRSEVGDMGIQHSVDPYSDTSNLLGEAGAIATNSPRGDFMGDVDTRRWQASSPRNGYRGIGRADAGEEEVDTSSYDYFRGAAHGRR